MASISVKSITLWRVEVENRPGTLADALGALAEAGANLKLAMAYRFPGNESRGAIELYPVAGRKATAAARRAGLSESGIPTLLVEGDDKPGLGAAFARGLSAAGINVAFFVAQAVGRRYAAVIGFDTVAGARKAAPLLRKAKAAKR
jgi:hypothetical protein